MKNYLPFTKLWLYILFIVGPAQLMFAQKADSIQEPRFTPYNIGQEFTAITVSGKQEKVWAGTYRAGVFNLDISLDKPASAFSKFSRASGSPDLSQIKINSMASDSSGNVWVAHSGINFNEHVGGMERIAKNLSVRHFAPDRNALGYSFAQRDGLGTRDVYSITVDVNNTIWAAQRSHHLRAGNDFILTPGTISHKKEGEVLFYSRSTWWDPETGAGGSNLTPELPYPAYTRNPPISKPPQSRNMQAISADKDEVWVGAWAYTYLIGRNDEVHLPHRILRYDLNGNYIPSGSAGEKGGMGLTYEDMKIPTAKTGVINGIYRNNAKGVWVTTSSGEGFAVFHEGEWHYIDSRQIIPEGTRFNNNAIWGDDFGKVFMGTTKGLIIYDGHGPAHILSSYKLYTDYDYGAAAGNELNIHDPSMISSDIRAGATEPDNPYKSWLATANGIMKMVLVPESLTIYHVKEKTAPHSPKMVDGEDNYIPMAELQRESKDYPVQEENIPSFAADSTTSSVFRYRTEDPEGFYKLTKESYKLVIGPGSPLNKDTEEDDYVRRYGKFTLKPLSFYEGNVSEAKDLEFVDFAYQHPGYIDQGDYVQGENHAKFDLTLWDIKDPLKPKIIFTHPVKVTVPPVLLGHGVWSDIGSLANIEAHLKENGFDDFMLMKAWRTDGKAAENAHSQDAHIIPLYIKKLREKAVGTKLSAGKVNIIVHSRGGLYTRAYIEGVGSNITYNDDIHSLITLNTPHSGSQAASLVMDKRIISHHRIRLKEGGHFLLPGFVNLINQFEIEKRPITLGEVISLSGFPPKKDRDNNQGAKHLLVVNDLLSGVKPPEDPRFIEKLNDETNLAKLKGIPIHAVATTFSACEIGKAYCNDLTGLIGEAVKQDIPDKLKKKTPKVIFRFIWVYNVVETILNDIPKGIDGLTGYLYRSKDKESEPNDLIVPLASMEAGLKEQYVSNFEGENVAHIAISGAVADVLAPNASGVTENKVVLKKLVELLKQNVHDGSSNFTKDGIKPPALSYLFLNKWSGDIVGKGDNNGRIAAEDPKIFINKNPEVFGQVSEGKVLDYNIYAENVDKIMVIYEHPDFDDLIYEVRKSVDFKNPFNYQVPKGYFGEVVVKAAGFKDKKLATMDTITFNVGLPSGVALQSIRIEEADPIIQQFDRFGFQVIGTFSDDTERTINSMDGLTLNIENTDIAAIIDQKTVQTKTIGTTTLTASVSGKTAKTTITVVENPNLNRTLLSDFYANASAGNAAVEVFWKTFREYESKSFILERSLGTPNNFSEIHQQPGNGTSPQPEQFSHTDTGIGGHKRIYYRLRMIDNSGKVTYSPIIEVVLVISALSDDLEHQEFQLYPNPVTGNQVNLSLDTKFTNEQVSLEVYDINGRKLSQQRFKLSAGSHEIKMKVSPDMENGIYLIRLINKNYIKTARLVLKR